MSTIGPRPAAGPQRRQYTLTPGHLLLVLLVLEGFLWMSERSGWPVWHKGYAVLVAMATVVVWILMLLVWFVLSLLFRWRFHVNVYVLLLLVVAVAVPCSWLTLEMKKAERQMTAVKVIAQDGGASAITYDYEVRTPGEWVYRPDDCTDCMSAWFNYERAEPPQPAWLRKRFGNDFFITVVAAAIPSDVALARLKDLPRLRELKLSNREFSDVGLKYLDEATQIEGLNFGVTATDTGLKWAGERV